MDAELKSLEDKIDRFVRLYHDTCNENARLRELLDTAEAKNQQLAERMLLAAERLRVLLNSIPEK